jgi:mannose-6-phosphate isomerase-like protein (cupin superfamily)
LVISRRVDTSQTIEEFIPIELEREWGKEVILGEGPGYLGKLLLMKKGTRGGLQFHVEKDETFYLSSGEAEVEYAEDGTLHQILMTRGMSFHIPPGAIHRVTALTNCVFFEVSTDHHEDRVHAESFFGLPETGGLPDTWRSEDGEVYEKA